MADEQFHEDNIRSDEENHDMNNAVVPANPPENADDDNKVVELVVSYNDDHIKFKMRQNVKFKKLFQKYCAKMNLDPAVVRFHYDEARISHDHTPADHKMKDGDEINVFLWQDGGA